MLDKGGVVERLLVILHYGALRNWFEEMWKRDKMHSEWLQCESMQKLRNEVSEPDVDIKVNDVRLLIKRKSTVFEIMQALHHIFEITTPVGLSSLSPGIGRIMELVVLKK